jgi:uncharacterized protein (TIGR01777 family)
MNILITGASGFIGQQLINSLLNKPYHIFGLSRNPKNLINIFGEKIQAISMGEVHLYPFDVVINLAGAGILDLPWTSGRMKELRNSRIDFTRELNAQLKLSQKKQLVSIHASAIGYYGIKQGTTTPLSEKTPPGTDWCAILCQDWEHAAQESPSERIVSLRFGIVLDPHGGALKKMISVFNLGLGGMVGTGQQIMSWIALEDVIKTIEYAILEPRVEGPINLVSSQSVTNKEFSHLLAKHLYRPCFMTMPGFALKMIYREGATLLTEGSPISNNRLKELGYHPQFENLDEYFRMIFTQN